MSENQEIDNNSAPSEAEHSTSGTNSVKSEDLSVVDEFDELMQIVKQQNDVEIYDKFLYFAEEVKLMNNQVIEVQQECQRLQKELVKRGGDYNEMELKLNSFRKLLDQERKHNRGLLASKDSLQEKVLQIINLCKNNKVFISEELRQELKGSYKIDHDDNVEATRLTTIHENTTGSLLSDFSYSVSEDDLDASTICNKTWKKHKSNKEQLDVSALKKPCSSSEKFIAINSTDTIRATTTVTVDKGGPITATSVIESIPSKFTKHSASSNKKIIPGNDLKSTTSKSQHSLQVRTVIMPENCHVCKNGIGFGRSAYKCKDCHALCHRECKHCLPLPCTSIVSTPTKKGIGLIGDYTPPVQPMIPSILIHCIEEIERRGLNKTDIYKISASQRDIKALKVMLLKRKELPCLTNVDIHVICGVIKDFLSCLDEPLITNASRADFIKTTESKSSIDINPILYQLVSDLPKPNQDTLAYMILHLKKVVNSSGCGISIKNLVKIFEPIIVGSSDTKTNMQYKTMKALMNLPNDYWEEFINCAKSEKPSNTLQQTPSTDSLLGAFLANTLRRKKQKIFPPP